MSKKSLRVLIHKAWMIIMGRDSDTIKESIEKDYMLGLKDELKELKAAIKIYENAVFYNDNNSM